MDHHGERRNPIIQLDEKSAEFLLNDSGSITPIRAIHLYSSGYSNTNYRIELADFSVVVLKVFTNSLEKAKLEIRLLQHVEGRVAVPKVLYFDTSLKQIPYCFALLECKSGQLLGHAFKQFQKDDALKIGLELGQTLAQLSQFRFSSLGLLNSDLKIQEKFDDMWEFFFPFIESCLIHGKAKERLGDDLTQRVLRLITENQSLVKENTIGASLVHGDFNGKNILVELQNGNWTVNTILDWEFACAGPYLIDLGNLLRYDAQLPTAFEKGIVSGFLQGGGYLSRSWKKVAKLLDLMNLCEFLNTKMERPILWEDSKSLIMDTLNRWETF